MEPSSKVSFAARRSATAHDDHHPRGSETFRVESTQETLQLVEMHRVNLMLMGGDEVVQPMVESLAARFHQPVGTWSPGERLVLPPAERTGTMVLNDVGAMALQEQILLLEWLGTATGRTQVVSTTPAPLLPRVESGKFIDTLYYRLNTVCVDATI
jgi:hypothetical protein